jgi:hypothetical protein
VALAKVHDNLSQDTFSDVPVMVDPSEADYVIIKESDLVPEDANPDAKIIKVSDVQEARNYLMRLFTEKGRSDA